jgi:hypothetical protein
MTRRWALAAALFLTALFGFAVVSYGARAGIFTGSNGSAQNTAAQPPLAGSADPSTPGLITEIVIDPATGSQALQPGGQPPGDGAASSPSGTRETEREHGGEAEHEDDD